MTTFAFLLAVLVLGALLFRAVRGSARATPASGPATPAAQLPPPDPNVFEIRGFDFYVRLDPARRGEMLDAVRSAIAGDGTLYDQDTHGVVLWHDFNPPEALLQRLSMELDTQVIWLSFQRTVDAFEYARWESGALRRHLVYGCYEQERTWEKAEGEPESWEGEGLFGLRGGEGPTRVEVGAFEPILEARDAAEAVAVAFGLPGWELRRIERNG